MNDRGTLVSSLVWLAACAAVPADAEVVPSGPLEQPAVEPPSASHSYASTAPVLLEAEEQLGGKAITLHSDGWLIAGAFGRHVDLERNRTDTDGRPEARRLSLISVGPNADGVLLVLPTNDMEDPPSHYRLYVLPEPPATELVEVLDLIVGAYNHQELVFPGDGTARYMEDGWAACDRAGHPSTPVTLHEVLLSADESGMFTEFKRIEHGQTQDCSMLAG